MHSIVTKCIVLTFDHKDGYKKRDEGDSLIPKGIPKELSGAWSRELLTTMLQALAKQRTLAMVDGEHFGVHSLQCTTQQPYNFISSSCCSS